MMTDQFAFLGDNKCKCKAAIIAATVTISLGVLLLLLPASSLGYGATIISRQEAFGQFALPQLEEPEEDTTTAPQENGGIVVEEEEPEEDTTTTTTTPTSPTTTPPPAVTNYTNNIRDPSIFLLRGFIGSTLPTQNAGGGAITPAANDDSGYVVTGRFRVFANETLVRRFIAEMNVAAIDGSSFHNVTITEGDPHRFQVTEASSNGTIETSVPVVSSNILGTIYLDGAATPIIDNVPMTLTVRGQSLAVQGIDIDETRIADTGGGQRDAISVIDGQSIYGIVP
jgi:hypothetical protein